ncbi:MAG: S-ribosylhomocysteine lyase [Oscillospiraceae bacterium]|nr:S-ribosylhomocysteine lyase [Oscillospiraceae bacterium]
MQKIESFKVDHNKIDVGMYISRIDDNIVTYDVRMVKPNSDRVLTNDGIHTIEHLFATFARNTEFSKNIVYVGPMGCLTGFYFITRDLSHNEAIKIVKDSMNFIADYEGEIPGASKVECGNYKLHSLENAKNDIKLIRQKLQNYSEEQLYY